MASNGTMRSNREWRLWGERDPLYGVLTIPGHAKDEPGAWTEQSFYAHGAREWPRLRDDWQSFDHALGSGALVEIGCGAGRLTQALLGDFPHVYALDVSPDQLHYAETHLRMTPGQVEFLLGDGVSLPLPDKLASAVLSTHVFQHFDDPRDSLSYWREIFRVLQPGGTCLIQLPIHHWPWAARAYQMSYTLRRFVGHLVAEQKRRRGQSFLRVVSYDSDWLLDNLQRLGFGRIELRLTARPFPTERFGSHEPAYWAVFAQRPGWPG